MWFRSFLEQVRAQGRLGWSLWRIQRETGVGRYSVKRCLREAGIVHRCPRGRRLIEGPDSKPASQVFPDSAAAAELNELIKSPIRSCCEPHREFIEALIVRGRNGRRSGKVLSTSTTSPVTTSR